MKTEQDVRESLAYWQQEKSLLSKRLDVCKPGDEGYESALFAFYYAMQTVNVLTWVLES